MREIVHIQVGDCGNNIGSNFWEEISSEHRIDVTGAYHGDDDNLLENISVYYDNSLKGKYVPRSIMINSNGGKFESVKNGSYRSFFRHENFVFGEREPWKNFAIGHYQVGPALVDTVLDRFRKELECCEALQGLQFIYGIGGGTGSGVGSFIRGKITEEYPEIRNQSFSVFPSPKVSDCVLEPYNMVLALNDMYWNADCVYCFDNEAVFNICSDVIKCPIVRHTDMNNVISMALSGLTTSLRFPSDINSTIHKINMNMVPFPKLHFFIPGIAPFLSEDSSVCSKPLTVSEITEDVFSVNNTLVNCDLKQGQNIGLSAVYRGQVSLKDVDDALPVYSEKSERGLSVKWIPDNVKSQVCYVKMRDLTLSSTVFANSTSIVKALDIWSERFWNLWRRKAFHHTFCGEGMDSMEFDEAYASLNDLISEYNSACDTGSDNETHDASSNDDGDQEVP